jgi:hypothetical protein
MNNDWGVMSAKNYNTKQNNDNIFTIGEGDFRSNTMGPHDLNRSKDNNQQDAANDALERYSIMDEEFGNKGNVGTLQTYFNTFKCFIGIGILATPSAFKQVGLVGGAVGIGFVGLINMYTMKM